jgi:hypothetical protein
MVKVLKRQLGPAFAPLMDCGSQPLQKPASTLWGCQAATKSSPRVAIDFQARSTRAESRVVISISWLRAYAQSKRFCDASAMIQWKPRLDRLSKSKYSMPRA